VRFFELNLKHIEEFLIKLDSLTLSIFDKLKKKADKTNWLDDLINKYGTESNIPWKERRRALFRAIISACKLECNDELIRKATDLYALWGMARNALERALKLTSAKLDKVLRTLSFLHDNEMYPRGIFIWNPTRGELKKEIVREVLGDIKKPEELIEALDLGFYLNRILKNISPLIALSIILPCTDPANKKKYLQDARMALKLFMINDYWYSFIEKRSKPDLDHWEFWENFINEVEALELER